MPRRTPYFAAFLDLLGKKVVIVGGGKVATSKVRALLPCGPELIVVAPEASPFIARAARDGRLVWLQRQYRAADDVLDGATLAFGATDDRALNAQVAANARAASIPVLAVDDTPSCDFIAPALVQRGDLSVAISTGGRSPAMARRTRERLDQALPSHWGDLLEVAAAARERLGGTRTLIDADRWQSALRDVEHLVERGALADATDLLVHTLERSLFFSAPVAVRGFVSLVGAGPGDPELLTLKAVERLRAADVIVHDRLVGERVLDYAAPGAELIDVGKASGGRGPNQAEINALLIELAQQGRRVVRLKGGDPFVFGRGGEEMLALARAGVAFEVVPGVTSAVAAPAAAGIPVTHRGMSSSVTVLNGHDPDQHEWPALAASGGTLVFLMAVEHLEDIARRLVRFGRSIEEPVAVIERATTPRQRVIPATLGDVASVARREHVEAPAVVVVGPTAALAGGLGTRGIRHTSAAATPQDDSAERKRAASVPVEVA